jgi:hypothetical protein
MSNFFMILYAVRSLGFNPLRGECSKLPIQLVFHQDAIVALVDVLQRATKSVKVQR